MATITMTLQTAAPAMRDGDSLPEASAPAAGNALPGELLVWLSPVFPVGGFAYSQGLEAAVSRQLVHDMETLADWLDAVAAIGALRNDLVIMAAILRSQTPDEILAIVELAAALQPSAERWREAVDQGGAFWAAYSTGWRARAPAPGPAPSETLHLTLPVAVAMAAREYRFAPEAALEAYAIGWAGNLVSAAIRLGVIGQFQGQQLLAGLLPQLRASVNEAHGSTLDDLGAATFGADLASMLHETQTTRLFRS